MSRKTWKLSDFDKYLKPMHLAGKQITLTVTHIGVETIKARKREFTIAGNAPEEQPDDLLLILHFREYPKPLRLNNLNRSKLRELIGDDPSNLIGRKITLRPITLKQFGGQEAIDIVSVEKGKIAPQPEPEPEPESDDTVKEIELSGTPAPEEWKEEIDAEAPPADGNGHAPESSHDGQPVEMKITASDFGKAVHDLHIDAKTARAIGGAYTVAGVTDWAGAIRELQAKAQ